jgi:NTE family protein
MTDTVTLADNPRGYQRDAETQQRFDVAADKLRAADGQRVGTQPPQLVADLVLEGGGVKGIGLAGAILVLDEAGYRFRAVAGTSAGAVGALLVAAITKAGRPMAALRGYLESVDYTKFMPGGKVHHFLDRVSPPAAVSRAQMAVLAERMGLYSGDYLKEWLGPIIHDDLGVRTFADLRLDPRDDPEASLAPERQYSVVVHTSDVTRGVLARLPWDYSFYGLNPDEQDPVDAVRASMSIPFFFEPVEVQSRDAVVELPQTGGGVAPVRFAAGTQTWVDGGLLANFPIHAFDRTDDRAPRWPTLAIRLSSYQQEFGPTTACQNSQELALRCLKTLVGEWDSYQQDEATAQRTIYVDHGGLAATDFDITRDQQNVLFLNGVQAATQFIIRAGESNGVPLR